MCEHSEDVEADLSRFYPRDADQLAEFIRGEMTMRRLWVLVSRLPPESFTQAVMSGRPGEGIERVAWSPLLHLVASVQEQLQSLNYNTVALQLERGKKNPVPAPKAIPRPGIEVA